MNSQNLKASVSFVGDGTTNKFYFGFDYINKQFVKVQIGNEGQSLTYPSDYTVDDRSVVLKDTPAVGVAIRVYRETSSDRIVEWADGAFIKASQMTLENLQQLHLIEEAQDYPILNSLSKYPDGVNFNALGSRVINVSDPKDPQDAVTKHYMESVQNGFVTANTILVQEATKQANAAKAFQESAKASATQASGSERASLASANLSEAWATSTTSPDNTADAESATGTTQSSRTWALFSKSKAQAAKTSETNAKTSKTNAKTSETNAKTSETKAAVSEANAKTSETNAKSSEINARDSASASASSAHAAATSATKAHNSETAAANSAKQAAESAGVFQDFTGATATTDGTSGKVPKPSAGQQNKVLKGDGTWGDGVTPKTLWDGMHSYPENYVPADVSNVGWNRLGVCSIYYTQNKINNQPTQYGQLINLPADEHNESTQLWLSQPDGMLFSRSGNTNYIVNDTAFRKFATLDAAGAEGVDSQGDTWIRYTSGLQMCWNHTFNTDATWSYPVPFNATPTVQATVLNQNSVSINLRDVSNTRVYIMSDRNASSRYPASVLAIGRWK